MTLIVTVLFITPLKTSVFKNIPLISFLASINFEVMCLKKLKYKSSLFSCIHIHIQNKFLKGMCYFFTQAVSRRMQWTCYQKPCRIAIIRTLASLVSKPCFLYRAPEDSVC